MAQSTQIARPSLPFSTVAEQPKWLLSTWQVPLIGVVPVCVVTLVWHSPSHWLESVHALPASLYGVMHFQVCNLPTCFIVPPPARHVDAAESWAGGVVGVVVVQADTNSRAARPIINFMQKSSWNKRNGAVYGHLDYFD
jgi:hypothetical protein